MVLFWHRCYHLAELELDDLRGQKKEHAHSPGSSKAWKREHLPFRYNELKDGLDVRVASLDLIFVLV